MCISNKLPGDATAMVPKPHSEWPGCRCVAWPLMHGGGGGWCVIRGQASEGDGSLVGSQKRGDQLVSSAAPSSSEKERAEASGGWGHQVRRGLPR